MPLLTTEASKIAWTSKNLCSTYSIPSLRSKITPKRVCNVYHVICVDMLIKETKFKHCLQMLWLIFVIHKYSTCLSAENVIIYIYDISFSWGVLRFNSSFITIEISLWTCEKFDGHFKYCFAHVTSKWSTWKTLIIILYFDFANFGTESFLGNNLSLT